MAIIDNDTQTLEQALKNTLPQAERVDILTAYFYFSGFSTLLDELKDKKIRILVGKAIDPERIKELIMAQKQNPNVDLANALAHFLQIRPVVKEKQSISIVLLSCLTLKC